MYPDCLKDKQQAGIYYWRVT